MEIGNAKWHGTYRPRYECCYLHPLGTRRPWDNSFNLIYCIIFISFIHGLSSLSPLPPSLSLSLPPSLPPSLPSLPHFPPSLTSLPLSLPPIYLPSFPPSLPTGSVTRSSIRSSMSSIASFLRVSGRRSRQNSMNQTTIETHTNPTVLTVTPL